MSPHHNPVSHIPTVHHITTLSAISPQYTTSQPCQPYPPVHHITTLSAISPQYTTSQPCQPYSHSTPHHNPVSHIPTVHHITTPSAISPQYTTSQPCQPYPHSTPHHNPVSHIPTVHHITTPSAIFPQYTTSQLYTAVSSQHITTLGHYCTCADFHGKHPLTTKLVHSGTLSCSNVHVCSYSFVGKHLCIFQENNK